MQWSYIYTLHWELERANYDNSEKIYLLRFSAQFLIFFFFSKFCFLNMQIRNYLKISCSYPKNYLHGLVDTWVWNLTPAKRRGKKLWLNLEFTQFAAINVFFPLNPMSQIFRIIKKSAFSNSKLPLSILSVGDDTSLLSNSSVLKLQLWMLYVHTCPHMSHINLFVWIMCN